MGDFDDGYNNHMRPGGNNWDAFNRGVQQRNHDQATWSMIQSQQQQTSQWLSSSSQPPPIFIPSVGPMTAREARRWKIGLAVAAILTLSFIVILKVSVEYEAWASADRARDRAAFHKMSEETEGPRLASLLASLDPRREVSAVERFVGQSDCHARAIDAMFRQPRPMALCGRSGGIPGHLEHSFFETRIEEGVRMGKRTVETRTEISVYPFSPYNLSRFRRGGRALQLSRAEAERMLQLSSMPAAGSGKACAAFKVTRTASAKIGNGRFDTTVGQTHRLPIRLGCFQQGRLSLAG